MNAEDMRWRRSLARELTARTRAPFREAIEATIAFSGKARRVGISGPPGAGKSSLIAMLAQRWASSRTGVLAIDPTSPLSGGALLGDRIRMEAVSENPDLFIRSVSSGAAHDGLCPNVLSLLDAFEQAGFDQIILETVGVGQVSYEAKSLVDTFVLVLVPESGDTVQAMKAGILEMADIYVVNKADLPTSPKLAAELQSIAAWRGTNGGWVPPVILTSAAERYGDESLVKAIEDHRATLFQEGRFDGLVRARREYHLRSLLAGRIEEILTENRPQLDQATRGESLRLILKCLGTMI